MAPLKGELRGSIAGWSKLLTSYDGESIDYDEIGNPVSYRGATLTWDGRELKTYSKNGTNISYKYDADGLRASKTVNGAKTTYQYVDGQLLYENRNGTDIYYYYDSYGTPTSVVYYLNGKDYGAFNIATNQQGDVIALYNANANIAVKYEYDAWGRIISTTNANGGALTETAAIWNEINPFRYRGYYYDAETELYYLQSRYYDAEVGRFINSDVLLDNRSLNTINPFIYCGNNPILYVDYSGDLCVEHAGGGGVSIKNNTSSNNSIGNKKITNNNALNKMIDVATETYIQRTNMEIDMYLHQYRMIKGFVEKSYDNYNFSMQLQIQQERQQAVYEQKIIVDRFSTPEKAANTFAACSVGLEALAMGMVKVSPKTASILEGVAIFLVRFLLL